MKTIVKSLGVPVLCIGALVSCATTGWPAQVDASALVDAPDRFLVLDPASGATAEASGAACRSPLVDPRDGTRLTLVRSQPALGDYRVEAGRYGVADSRLLRADCRSGRAVGVTPSAD